MKFPSRNQLKDEVFSKLRSIGQENLFSHWEKLSLAQKEKIFRQVTHLDTQLFLRQQAAILKSQTSHSYSLQPYQSCSLSGNSNDYHRGLQLVQEGKTALLVLAGGQGSRLRCKGPKGCRAVTKITQKSLYQLLAEKVKAVSKQAKRELEIAIMTSPLNHVETETFFAEHAFFGLKSSQVTFFNQPMWPLLNFQGNLFLEEPDQIARGPNGNGSVFRRLVDSGIWKKWKNMGIEMVNVVPIDNPLANPFDFELFGFHAHEETDITIKASRRFDVSENVGVLALLNNKVVIIEYSELKDADKEAITQEGILEFDIANLGLFCFSMPFIQHVSQQELPLHLAKKTVSEINSAGAIILPEEPNAWKFEEFIFDLLPFAEHVRTILFPRALCFAPLKNLKGADSIDTVHAALLAFDRQVFETITGNEPPHGAIFELSAQFYYPTVELLETWRGKPFPNKDYIHE